MGRAGRPQFDTSGVASILVHEPKKQFYKKFLYEPFPVESSLHGVLHDHFNAEIVGGTIKSKQVAPPLCACRPFCSSCFSVSVVRVSASLAVRIECCLVLMVLLRCAFGVTVAYLDFCC